MGTLWWLWASLALACASENPATQAPAQDLGRLLVTLRGELDSSTVDLLSRFSVGDTDGRAPWHSRAAQVQDDHPRDELAVTSLAQDDTFKYGAGVDRWLSLVVGTTTYLVGLRPDGLSLVTASLISPDVSAGQTTSYSATRFDTAGKPLAATLFKHWNSETKVSEAILVLAIDTPLGDLNWYRIGNGVLEKIHSWPLHKLITYVKVFAVHDQLKLLIFTPCDNPREGSPCEASANLYDFTLTPQDSKLSQSLKLEGNATAAEVGIVGDEFYLALALPEAGLVKVYKYNQALVSELTGDHSTYGWFEPWKELHSPGVSHVVFFHVSFKLYLAIGGAQPALLRFVSPTRLEGCPKAMQGLGFVSSWMVLPVSTYREEVILLAQLETMSVNSRSVVVLTWGGVGVFRLQQQPPCIREKQSVNGGASCLVFGSNALGLSGAVALSSQSATVSVLVPHGAEPSALFLLYTQMYPLSNPLLYELSVLKQMRAQLEMEMNLQASQVKEIESMLSSTLQVSGPNIISSTWVVQEIYTPEHVDAQNTTSIDLAGQQGLNSVDVAVEISDLETLMFELQKTMQNVNETVADAAIPLNGEVHVSGTLTVLGGVEIMSSTTLDSVSLVQLNGESVPHLIKNAVRHDRMDKIGGTKTLLSADIDHVQFGTVNDVPGDQLVFNTPGKSVVIDGNLVVTHALHVLGSVELPTTGTVNGIDLSEELFQPGKTFKGQVRLDQVAVEGDLTVDTVNEVPMHPYHLRSIVMGVGDLFAQNDTKYDSLQVDGQLVVERINGYLWDDLMQRIVWKNSPDHIEGTTIIEGVLNAEQGMEVWQLNDLSFPEDYVLRKGGTQHISGTKTVMGQFFTNSADVSGTVDGVPVQSLVTLTSEQYLDGELRLNEADIMGDIKVDWGINGISLDRILNRSPVLGQGGVVSSNVRFSNLEVVGNVVVSGDLDGHNFNEYLSDIVLIPEVPGGNVILSGLKEFKAGLSVGGPGLTIQTGLLSGVSVQEYISTDTPQTLKGEKVIERATFGNLYLSGTWDGVDVQELNADTIRLNGNQESMANLSFVESGELWASRLVISKYLNTELTTAALKVNEGLCDASAPSKECIINGPVSVDTLRVAGNIVLDGQVCGWDLVDFEMRRLSRARPQTVTGSIKFGDVQVVSHLTVSSLNKISIESWAKTYRSLAPHDQSYNLNEMLAVGGFAIDELYIEGNIYTSKVNGFSLADIAKHAINLGKNNRITSSLIFEDILRVGVLNVYQRTNGLNISLLVEDAVLKQGSHPVAISGLKVFDGGLIVDGNINTQFLNGLAPSKIVTKSSPHHLQGPLRVTGNAHAANVNVSGHLNGISIDTFVNRYKLLGEGRHLLQGNIRISGDVVVDDLYVMELINGRDINNFFESVVVKTETSRITGNKLFLNKVIFHDVEVEHLVNGMALKEFAADVVVHNDENPVTIEGRIIFANSVTAHGGVSLSGNLEAKELDGCLIQEWFDNAVYLDQPQHVYGYKTLLNVSSKSNLKLSVLNALDLEKVIPLHTDQEIPGKLKFIAVSVQHDVEVGGLVNSRSLQAEVKNTLLTIEDQTVMGQKVFLNGLTVKGNLVTTGLVTGRDLKNVVTLNSPQVIKGALRFQNMVVEGNMRVLGRVSGVDVKKWKERALLRKSPDQQIVTGRWTVQQNVRFMDEVLGHGLLGGEDVNNLAYSAEHSRQLTRTMQEKVKGDWEQLCHDTSALLEKARAQPFLFQQLEVVQAIPSTVSISSMHAFEVSSEQFLIVSYSENCQGALYRWNGDSTAWELQNDSVDNVGAVRRWATLKTSDGTYLATSSDNSSCNSVGGNIWLVGQGAQLQNVRSMDPWSEAQVDEQKGHLYTLGEAGVSAWSVAGGKAERLHNWTLSKTDGAQFIPRAVGLGLSVSDGESLSRLTPPHEVNSSHPAVSREANAYLPGRRQGNVASVKVAGGRKLVAVVPEDSDMLVVYEDALSGNILGRVWAHGAHSLSVLELAAPGRVGQTLLAFIEDERRLRVVEYKGVEGLVDVAVARLAVAVKEMVPVRLRARGLVNKRHFLLLRSDYQVLLVEVEMAGDPLDQPALPCALP